MISQRNHSSSELADEGLQTATVPSQLTPKAAAVHRKFRSLLQAEIETGVLKHFRKKLLDRASQRAPQHSALEPNQEMLRTAQRDHYYAARVVKSLHISSIGHLQALFIATRLTQSGYCREDVVSAAQTIAELQERLVKLQGMDAAILQKLGTAGIIRSLLLEAAQSMSEDPEFLLLDQLGGDAPRATASFEDSNPFEELELGFRLRRGRQSPRDAPFETATTDPDELEFYLRHAYAQLEAGAVAMGLGSDLGALLPLDVPPAATRT